MRITIYLPRFYMCEHKWTETSYTLRQLCFYKNECITTYDSDPVGSGKTKFQAILDYLKRGLR